MVVREKGMPSQNSTFSPENTLSVQPWQNPACWPPMPSCWKVPVALFCLEVLNGFFWIVTAQITFLRCKIFADVARRVPEMGACRLRRRCGLKTEKERDLDTRHLSVQQVMLQRTPLGLCFSFWGDWLVWFLEEVKNENTNKGTYQRRSRTSMQANATFKKKKKKKRLRKKKTAAKKKKFSWKKIWPGCWKVSQTVKKTSRNAKIKQKWNLGGGTVKINMAASKKIFFFEKNEKVIKRNANWWEIIFSHLGGGGIPPSHLQQQWRWCWWHHARLRWIALLAFSGRCGLKTPVRNKGTSQRPDCVAKLRGLLGVGGVYPRWQWQQWKITALLVEALCRNWNEGSRCFGSESGVWTRLDPRKCVPEEPNFVLQRGKRNAESRHHAGGVQLRWCAVRSTSGTQGHLRSVEVWRVRGSLSLPT